MPRDDYRTRVVDAQLTQLLDAVGGVVIEGPKACGKTRTGLQHAASSTRLDATPQAAILAQTDPASMLSGERPRLVDEWQLAPNIWNRVRYEIDEAGRPGQFIVTGSAVPADDVTRHSGAGRIARLRMRPFSLFESGVSTGQVSLRDLFGGEAHGVLGGDVGLPDVVDAICAGGWPGHAGDVGQRMESVDNYLAEIALTDVQRVDGASKDPALIRLLLSAWARGLSSETALTTIQRDMSREGTTPALTTLQRYVTALERLMIIEDLPAWRVSLRSRSRIRTSPKRQLVDPSIAVSALGASPERLMREGATLGMLFESLAVRDVRVYAGAIKAEVAHYRDNTGLEVDLIVHCRDGRWGALEVKLGIGEIDRAARALLRCAAKVDVERAGPPAFLGVITAAGAAYRREEDGVWVIPISLLGP